MAYTSQVLYEPLRSFNTASLSTSYQALGTPLTHAGTLIKLVNASNVGVTISTDGINDMDYLLAESTIYYEYTANTPPSDFPGVFVPEGTQYLIKGAGAGTGLVYLVVQYIPVG